MISKLLLYQLKITKDFQKNQEQDLKELSDGTNIGQTNQTKNNNLNYLIDPKFTKVNRLFVLSFEMKTIEHLFQNIMYQMFK